MTRRNPVLSGSAMIRRVCALGALFALFLQGSSGGHMLLVEHTRCAEHGELVHQGVAHEHAAHAHTDRHTAAFESASDEGSDGAHEHCALTADRRDALGTVAESPVLTRVDATMEDVAFARTIFTSGASRIHVAPKNSPPA